MIPLIPTLALAFFSFICSAFVILRTVIPILPPGPLSRRVAPSEFGLPNFRSLSPTDKSHLWLASLDLIAVAVFVWEAVSEATGGPSGLAIADQPLASARLWFSMTLKQTCLLVILGLTLLHVRLARSVSFGRKHWMMWGPTLVLVATSTAMAGILTAAGMNSLFVGLVAYSSGIAALSSVALLCLIGTLLNIKRNLTALNDDDSSWPPASQMEEKPRPSFNTDEVDALRDGASWITSNASSHSRRDSVSAWSFSTHRTVTTSHHGHGRPQNSHPSVPAKSSFWFGSSPAVDNVPPVPPLPSPYGPLSPTSESLAEPDPFRRVPTPVPEHPRPRLGSQTSWLSSNNGSQATMSAWSYPTTQHEGNSTPNLHAGLLPPSISRPSTPALANAKVLGGYGYIPKDTETGLSTLAAPAGTSIDISASRAIGWLILIWLPLGLSLPYLTALLQNNPVSTSTSILITLSVMMSSPALALNMLFSPLPIPTGLFDVRGDSPTNLARGSMSTSTLPKPKWSHEYKRSGSVTVVEGRRSGDVWLANGDAVDGKSKLSRAFGMISPMPKLSVLPPEDEEDITPPLPIQDGDSSFPVSIHNRSYSETSAQFGRIRTDSKASTVSGADDSVAFASRIMVAQRHYSALAQTVHVPASPEKRNSAGSHLMASGNAPEVVAASGTAVTRVPSSRSQHLRTRSVSSVASVPRTPNGESFVVSPSPPPAIPLPPTPPNVRAARLAKHKRSFSSTSAGKFSFNAVDDMNEIDALTAGVLPILVPGLKVGGNMKIRDSPPATWRRRGRADDRSASSSQSRSRSRSGAEGKTARLLKALNEFGEEFSSPEFHSTPARTKAGASKARARKTSAHKRNHLSLPSLGLGKDGVHSLAIWSNEIGRAFENIGSYTALPGNVDIDRRKTVFGGESIANNLSNLRNTPEPTLKPTNLGRAMSTRTLGLRAEVPHGVDTARSSIVSINRLPPSAASTATLFEELLADGPQAESTPHNTVSHKRLSEDVPPLPSANAFRNSINNPRSSRRSSIVYIRSDDATTVTPPNQVTSAAPSSSSSLSSFAQWSSRAVRPLIQKSSKLQRKASKVDPTVQAANKADSPRSGLRPLSLLQDRDSNTYNPSASSTVSVNGTRPLTLGKKQNSRKAMAQGTASSRTRDENSPEQPRLKKQHNLKPLNLARTDTRRMRGILREEEELPDVVVRPPSNTEHQVYAYTFRG
ncbi:hypothetical protein K435DRAFT_958839 [Dendrothele bispora CBS 962.96]|uniref:Uncharacterized protein n=1 Tax=Dendrothele bispora (strain CBS 962.96) TaxID=1314807 RepID=A0A4S8MXW7_DENBC|nr:hypothetical protein K435DRAFT_958839 [Dendrothele bispora CBS 962.96]